MTMKRGVFTSLAGALFQALFQIAIAGPIVLPDFTVVGQRWGRVVQASEKELPMVFPKQVITDINASGQIYGISCEYRYREELFGELRAEIQKTIRVEPKLVSTNMVAWRNETQKLTVILILDKETESIKVGVVSIDKSIRRD